MHVTTMSKKPQINGLNLKNPVKETCSGGSSDWKSDETVPCRKEEMNLLRRICHGFSGGGNDNFNVVQTGGAYAGVAFFLHFSVHAAKNMEELGEDTRILPVHYTDNYFSLVPGEAMTVNVSFESRGVTPRVRLHGWNYHSIHTVF